MNDIIVITTIAIALAVRRLNSGRLRENTIKYYWSDGHRPMSFIKSSATTIDVILNIKYCPTVV